MRMSEESNKFTWFETNRLATGTVAAIVATLLCVGAVEPAAASSSMRGQTDGDLGGGALSEYTMGVFLLESESAQSAIPHLAAAWEMSAHDLKIGGKLAEAYFRAGEFESCDVVLDELIERDKKASKPLLLRAKMRYIQGRKDEAAVHLKQLRKKSKPSFEVERLLGKILLELGRDKEALSAYERAIRLDGSYPYLHYRYGTLLQKHDRIKDAEKAYRTALQLEPRFSEAGLELADILADDQRLSEAEAVLLQVLKNDGRNHDALMKICMLYTDQGKLDQAIQLLEEQGREYDLPPEGILLLGRLYYEAKDYEEALRIFQVLYDPENESSEMARVLGEISLKVGKTDEARSYFERAIKFGPNEYRNYLALFFAGSERFNSSESAVIELSADESATLLDNAAAEVAADDFEGLYLVGISYQSLDQLDESKTYLKMARDLNPDDERLLLNLAGVLEKRQEYNEAEDVIKRLHKIAPDDPTACNFYGYLLSLMGKNLKKAEKLILTALKSEPQNGYYIDSLGWVYYMMGDYDRAVIELEKASGFVKDDPIILEHLGDAYQAVRQYRQALNAYQKSKDLQGDNVDILDKIDSIRKQLGD